MKKLNKFFAVLVALAMMATLCVITAFADPDPSVNKTGEAYLTKTWTTNDGTNTPATTPFGFEFSIVQDKQNGVANVEDLSANKITFDANQTGTKMSNNLLANADWRDGSNKVVPGKYVYTVTEAIPESLDGWTKAADGKTFTKTVKSNNDKTTTTQTLTFDDNEYTMAVYVNKDGEVEGVVVYDEATKVTSNKPGEPGQDGLVAPNGFNFKNTYSEKVNTTPTGSDPTDPDPEDPDDEIIDGATLYVEKTIEAENAAQIDTDQAFSFSTTVEFPAIDSSDSYTAIVVDKTGAAVDPAQTKTFTKPATADEDGKYKATQTYTLRHGDRLVFQNIDIGAKYTTEETGTYDGYTQKDTTPNVTTAVPVTAEKNAVSIINTFTKGGTVPDSGIIISNLPYIVLALVAVGGLVAYVVVRRRQSDEA